jgi:uncharacterized membrane protein YfcA
MTGWLGWGAAQVLIPGLPGLGATPLQAGALSLCTLAGITLASSYKFFEEESADLPRAVALGVPALLFAPLGAVAAGRVAGHTLQMTFNALCVVVMPAQSAYFSWKLFQPAAAVASTSPSTSTSTSSSTNSQLAALPSPPGTLESTYHALFGTLIGFSSGFLGVAGLPFVVTWYSTMSDLTHQQCVGTTFMACTPAVLAGATAHIVRGNVPFVILAPLAVGATVGTYIGAIGHLNTPTPILQGAIALSLAVAGGRAGFSLRRLLAMKF